MSESDGTIHAVGLYEVVADALLPFVPIDSDWQREQASNAVVAAVEAFQAADALDRETA